MRQGNRAAGTRDVRNRRRRTAADVARQYLTPSARTTLFLSRRGPVSNRKTRTSRPKSAVTRLLVMSAPRNSNRFVSVYPALVLHPCLGTRAHECLIAHSAHRNRAPARLARKRRSSAAVDRARRHRAHSYALPRCSRCQSTWLAGLAIRRCSGDFRHHAIRA